MFTLPVRAVGTLEVMDVSGRRVWARGIGDLEPSRHLVWLEASWRPRPGVYLLRLTQGGESLVRRAVLID